MVLLVTLLSRCCCNHSINSMLRRCPCVDEDYVSVFLRELYEFARKQQPERAGLVGGLTMQTLCKRAIILTAVL